MVPLSLFSSFQNLEVNILSLSETIVLGNPCSLTTISTNNSAINVAVKSNGKAPRWQNLDSLSTTTKIVVFPLILGRCVMKFMDMSCQTILGMGKGVISHIGLLFKDLVY